MDLDIRYLDGRVLIGILLIALGLIVVICGFVCIAQGIADTPKKTTIKSGFLFLPPGIYPKKTPVNVEGR